MRHAPHPLILIAAFLPWSVPSSSQAQWTAQGLALSAAANDQQLPTIVSDGAGGAIVTWQDLRNGAKDIYAQKVNAAGIPQWTSDGVALSTAAGDQWEPKIASDGAGGAIVAWYDNRGGATADIYAQRVDAAGIPQWTIDGVALSVAPDDQVAPNIVSDGAGGAIVAWHDRRSGTNYDVYAQRVSAAGVPLWTPNGVVVSAAANNQTLPTIAADGAGGAIVSWEDLRSGATDIYAQRMDASGAALWTPNGVAVCAAPGGQITPAIAPDGAGGAFVTWRDGRSGARGIYARWVSASGTPQWTPDGVALSTAGTFQLAPAIVSDAAGGAIVTWLDNRNVNYDIFARRVGAAGVAQWAANGAAVCTDASDQSFPTTIPDGAGGAIVSWSDSRSGTVSDIFCQRMSSSGLPQWTPNGIALTSAGDGITPTIASDGAQGAIITWYDYRSGLGSDIYAQHVNASGGLPTAVPEPTRKPSLLAGGIHPNPFSGTATLELELTTPSAVRVEVFDVAGRTLRTLTLQDGVGPRRIQFDGRNDRGRLLPGGVYFYRVTAEGKAVTSKMVIAR